VWADWVSLWWQHVAGASLQVLVLAAMVAALDRALGRRAWPGLLTALWLLVLVKLLLPPGLSSPLSLANLWPTAVAEPAGGRTLQNVPPAESWAGVLFVVWEAGTLFFRSPRWSAIVSSAGRCKARTPCRRLPGSFRSPSAVQTACGSAGFLGCRFTVAVPARLWWEHFGPSFCCQARSLRRWTAGS
jgi:hypothetical protein